MRQALCHFPFTIQNSKLLTFPSFENLSGLSVFAVKLFSQFKIQNYLSALSLELPDCICSLLSALCAKRLAFSHSPFKTQN
jgi:hypothetical protein